MKKHIFFLIIISIHVLSLHSQTIVNYSDEDSAAFGKFLELFEKIERTNTKLTIISPENAGFGKEIDSSYYHFFETIPYFQYGTAFRIDFTNGHLLCIAYEYGNEYTDLIFLQLFVYNSDGQVVDKILLPYLHNAIGPKMDKWNVLVSANDIYCISIYKQNGNLLECEGIHFTIDYVSSSIVLNPENHFIIPISKDLDGRSSVN